MNKTTTIIDLRASGRKLPLRAGLILFFLTVFFNFNGTAQVCCPDFILKDAVDICPVEGACSKDSSQPGMQADMMLAACKESAHVYTVYPNDAAYTYTWTVNGGTVVNPSTNPGVIVWGSGNVGYIKVVISNLATGGTCVDSITTQVCLLDSPKADFTVDHDTVCVNMSLQFTNLSLGGAEYVWDFGDGSTSTDVNPLYPGYASPGVYTVTLTATDMGAGRWVSVQGEPSFEMLIPCGCSDTITKKIVVLAGEGPKIDTDCCYGTVCAGDTSSFCTPAGCPTYDWAVTGGTIISGAGTNCVQVAWSATYAGPTTISLETPLCSTSPCDATTTLHVPVLYPNLPIIGPATLCQAASGTFTLPTLPGTYYTWTVSGGGYQFNLEDRNTPSVNITFFDAANYTVTCVYDNPLAGCSGTSTFIVKVLPEFVFSYGEERVCEGETKSYYTNGAATWSVSPAGPTIAPSGSSANITWNSPGTYTITASATNPANFCNSNAVKLVEVIAKPVLNPIAGNDSVCPGDNFTYSISSDTGDNMFVWAISGGTGTIQSEMGANHDSVVVQWTGAGPWQLSVYQEVEIDPGVFCTSDVELLDVYPFLPPVIDGASTVCVDASEVYTAGGSNASGDFDWSISPAAQGTIQSGQGSNSVTILWHGPSASATLTVTSCTGSDSHTINITGRPIADVSYSTLPVFCQGDAVSLVLSTPFFGTYNYEWFKVGTGSLGILTNTLSINVASLSVGTHKYYVNVSENGCVIKSNIVDVIIKNCEPGTPGGPPGPAGCDVIAWFWPYVDCHQVTLIDKSYTLAGAIITNWAWAVSPTPPGTSFDNPAIPNPILTVPTSGAYTITLVITSSSGCISSYSEMVNILLPNASFTYTAPLCDNTPISFAALPNNPSYNYEWNFGDGFTSYTANTEHTYGPPAPTSYTVSLVISDEKGCIANTSQTIIVNPSPVCTITASDTIFCPGSFETLTACTNMSSYQWYKNGKPIPGANANTFNVYEHGEYHVVVTNTTNCSSASNKIYMYMNSLPLAKVTGEGHICAFPSSTSGVYLIANYNSNYAYSWSSNPPGATFSPANNFSTWASVNLPAVLPATYEFIAHVTDLTTGCINSDTLCVTFYQTPTVSVPYLGICEGTPVTLTPSPNDPGKYSYQWNTGATTATIVASNPGYYSLTMTDKKNGCVAYADAGMIYPKPDLSLFPLGCADICTPDTLNLYIPLPLNALWPNNTYSMAYPSITWYDNGNYGSPIGFGENLSIPAANTGSHQISVVVQNSFGCVDTAGVFCYNDNVCCDIILDYVNTNDASCINTNDGSISILLNPASVGAPFTITRIFPGPPQSWPIVPGVPFNLGGLSTGGYAFEITSANGDCKESFDLFIGYLQEECCFAAIDTNFIHITAPITYTSDMVWDNKYFIDINIMVTVDGVMLDVTNVDVVFEECAGIEFINGGYLRANNSVFRPCDIDKSWKGLRFDAPGEFDNIINESTFKNAEVALYFKGGSDAVISNNLFSNCNYGVRLENNPRFDHPVSGNRFVTENFFPNFACATKYSFVNNSSSYGIFASSSRFLNQISHNEFINSRGSQNPTTYGIYHMRSGGVFSENTFTDIGTAVYVYAQLYYTSIQNNEIEVNMLPSGNFTSIYALSCQGPLIEILNNEISNNYDQYTSFSGIYSYASNNVNISGNLVDGFSYGIIDISSLSHQISNNVVENARNYGIYVYEMPNSVGYVTCNSIKMKNFNSSIGLVAYNMSAQSEVSSNCITDCYTSMHFVGSSWGGNTMALPLIRNNFLYNYDYVGINVQGYSGNIGTAADPGLNTLWSNNNAAIDINSNTTINVADNFGMFNISFPSVQITSNNPYHSTASCGHQIFNMPSQGNLNTDYRCDNTARMNSMLMGSGGNFWLASDYLDELRESSRPYQQAALIMASLDEADLALLDEVLLNADLTENQIALLKFEYYYRKANYDEARANLETLAPKTEDETRFKTLSLLNLDIIEHGWGELESDEIAMLEAMIDGNPVQANFAIALLNNVNGFQNYIIEEPEAQHVVGMDNIKRITDEGGLLNIYPNPVRDIAYIELINTMPGDNTIEVYDISGQRCDQFSISIVSGGIELDISKLKDGIYFVTVSNPDSGISHKGKLVKIKN